jgi:hypothetical protein
MKHCMTGQTKTAEDTMFEKDEPLLEKFGSFDCAPSASDMFAVSNIDIGKLKVQFAEKMIDEIKIKAKAGWYFLSVCIEEKSSAMRSAQLEVLFTFKSIGYRLEKLNDWCYKLYWDPSEKEESQTDRQ